MIRPQPLPDELDRSYLGAAMRYNGIADEKVAMNMIASWDGSAGLSRRERPALMLLSKLAGLETTAFAMEHTTLPLRRSITSYLVDLAHGSSSNLALLNQSGLRATRPGVYLCQDCAWEDLDFHGRSYWRREHQIPGLFWCPKHRGPLSVADDDDAVLLPTTRMVGRSARFDAVWTDALQQHPLIARYVDLCNSLMDRPRPYPVTAARDALRVQARKRGYRTYALRGAVTRGTPLLSDAMLEAFPMDWLVQLVPGLKGKSIGVIVNQVDGVLWTATSASSATVYILALALLFKSSDEAHLAIEKAMKTQVSASRKRPPAGGVDPALIRYFGADASVVQLGRPSPADWSNVVRTLRGAGLQRMPRSQAHPFCVAVKAFFIDKESLDRCLVLSGSARPAFEALLRVAGCSLSESLFNFLGWAERPAPTRKRVRSSLAHLGELGVLMRPDVAGESGKPRRTAARRPRRQTSVPLQA